MAQQLVTYLSLSVSQNEYILFTVSDGDYQSSTSFIEFVPEGDTMQCVPVPVTDDGTIEPDEGLIVSFSMNGMELSTSTVTIIDNDGERGTLTL